MNSALSVVLGYLLGSIPFGWLLVRWRTGADIRSKGSGNIGAANVARESGAALGIAVLLLDAGKGLAAAMLAEHLSGGSIEWMAAAAFAAVAGHIFPVWLGFRGGKGVATFVGAFAWVAPLPTLAVSIVWLACLLITGHSSFGSMAAAATFPFALWMILHPPPALLLAGTASAALILWRHQENYRRLRAGTEARLLRRKS